MQERAENWDEYELPESREQDITAKFKPKTDLKSNIGNRGRRTRAIESGVGSRKIQRRR